MKLTWFGGTTIRIHIGGSILVVDADGAPAGIDRTELVSGADIVLAMGEAPAADAMMWRPRKVPRLLDETGLPAVECWTLGPGALLVEAIGEAPLVLVSSQTPTLGRWAAEAVFVLYGSGEQLAGAGFAILRQDPPRWLALAGSEAAIDSAIPALRDHLDGTGLVALEPGLALEV